MGCLFILHYHFRPGGVRSVMQRWLEEWQAQGRWERIVLGCGELPEEAWLEALRRLGKVEVRVDARLGYTSGRHEAGLRELLERWFQETSPDLVWEHNVSVGRNLALGEALGEISRTSGLPLLCHHHDWWVQQRWVRWQEFGGASWERIAAATLPDGPQVRHACAHPGDAALLAHFWGDRVAWIVPTLPKPERAPATSAPGQHWLAPSRILRRKNLLESVLLTRWFRPEGRLVISGTVSSAAEAAYGEAVAEGARRVGLELVMGAGTSIAMQSLYEEAEMVLQTSLQEGFGLTAWETAAHGKPLLLRRLPALTDAFEHAGAEFPGAYHDLRLPVNFLSAQERARQQSGWEQQCRLLPEPWHTAARAIPEPASVGFLSFSALTVAGQLELLADWPRLAAALGTSNAWLHGPALFTPVTAGAWPETGVSQMDRLLASPPPPPTTASSGEVLAALLAAALPDSRRFPLLWQ